MNSEDELSPEPPLSDISIQSRTLFHYFSKVKTQQSDVKSSSQLIHKTEESEKSDKQSKNTSNSDHCTSNTINGIHTVVQNGSTLPSKPKKQKRNTKDQEMSEDMEAIPDSKKCERILYHLMVSQKPKKIPPREKNLLEE